MLIEEAMTIIGGIKKTGLVGNQSQETCGTKHDAERYLLN